MTNSGREFDSLVQLMKERFHALGNVPLFTTGATKDALWNAYLTSFPEKERQFHNCNACRHFIERFGGLVTIDEHGFARSAIFDLVEAATLPTYAFGIACVNVCATQTPVNGVFVSSSHVWGTPQSDGWGHFYVKPPPAMVHPSRTVTAYQRMCEFAEDFKTLQHAFTEFAQRDLEQAVTLLTAMPMYRGEKFLAHAQWLLATYQARSMRNLVWRAVATAPAGYCHPRTSMIGSMLEDIQAGYSPADIKRRFEAKVAPNVYQRAQAAPTVGAIKQAEDLVAKLGIAPSLERRYARLAELQTIWCPDAARKVGKQPKPGVFGHLAANGVLQPLSQAVGNAPIVMTWDKFARMVLPSAQSIEALVPPTEERFAALVGPVHAYAPPILSWDVEGDRIPFSWYYAPGIDGEIQRRVEGAGGRYKDCDIRASLIWHNRNDLDLHCIPPGEQEIYFGRKWAESGGELDVDMNVHGETTTPVENIRWAKGKARAGVYRFWVENYRYHEYRLVPVPFRVELEVAGKLYAFEGEITGNYCKLLVAQFYYTPGVGLHSLTTSCRQNTAKGAGALDSWGLRPGDFVKVTGIVRSPNTWRGGAITPINGRHMFFLLEGCQDLKGGRGRGFFTEMLKSDLRPARATLEAYNASATIAGADEADACGLGMSDQAPWDLTLRVKFDSGIVATYKIDRWD